MKGYFQDRNDCAKYVWIRDSLDPYTELVFVFEDPDKPIHFQAKRQDGTKMTHAQWADKYRFRWFTEESIKGIL